MKKLNAFGFLAIALCWLAPLSSMAQSDSKPSVALVDFDTRGHSMNQQQVIQFLTNELIRIGQYEVMDKYDIEYLAKKDTLTLNGCFSKACLKDIGRRLKVTKMLTGSISELSENITVSLRLLDVQSGVFEKMHVKEFLNIPGNEFQMIRATLNEMFGLPNDAELVNKLTKKSELENEINNPYETIIQNDGPRIGVVMISGYAGQQFSRPESQGGNNGGYGNGSLPAMFQFGYQFEKIYLNSGNFQALFEFVPMVSGLDQGKFIPSLNFLNGLRSNVTGWEFAFGPCISLKSTANGYFYDNQANSSSTNTFYIEGSQAANDFVTNYKKVNGGQDPTKFSDVPDSRGSLGLSTGFLFAVGKTFRSGKLNLPVNIYFIPDQYGSKFGISMGWNGKDRLRMKNRD